MTKSDSITKSERTMIAFNSFDDALLVLQYSTDPEARVAALLFLERLLPSDVQAEMQRRACEVLGFTALTPDGFNAQGGPLYSASSVSAASGIPLSEVEAGAKTLARLMPEVDTTPVPEGPLATPGNPEKGRVWNSGETDEEGLPVYYMNGRAAMQLIADEVHVDNPKALEHLNKYIALALQRGCGEVPLARLKEAARREGGGKTFLKWLDRTSSHLPEETFVFEVLGLGMRR